MNKALKSLANDKFVSAIDKGSSPLSARAPIAAECEAFEIEDQGNGNIGILAIINGKYVCAEDAGSKPLIANQDRIGLLETFAKIDVINTNTYENYWFCNIGPKFAFKSLANDKFVCVESDDPYELIACSDLADAWETFEAFPHFPMEYGFKFNNNFKYDVLPAFDWREGGLCGGMCYAVLDYYFSNMKIPALPFRPADGTVLYNHIFSRQKKALESSIDKWAEITLNLGGIRNTEFFNWGVSLKPGERLFELKEMLDNGTPCVLGLKGDGGTGDHYLIAFGYTMGQYLGYLGEHIEDLKIYVYDPNSPNKICILRADPYRKLYYIEGDDTNTWRTYFVDKNYQKEAPPTIPNANYPVDDLVRELVLIFSTGVDDLREGGNGIDVIVNYTDGTQQEFSNINIWSRWVVGSEQNAELVLRSGGVKLEELSSLLVKTTFGGGIGGDNWDMTSLQVYAYGGGMFKKITETGFKRFTGDDGELFVSLPVARFTWEYADDKYRTVRFFDNSIILPTSWYWEFGDGDTSTEQNPTHKYDKIGKKDVKLTITSPYSSNMVTHSIQIGIPLTAFFSWIYYDRTETVKFINESFSIEAPISSWQWEFGDGTTSSSQNPLHRYKRNRKYTVTLRVNAGIAGNAEYTDYVFTSPVPP